MEKLSSHFQLMDSDLDLGTFRGIASVFGSMVDTFPPTVIESGAFTKTLSENGRRVKILWQHDVHQPLGLPITLQETDQGLEIVARISNTAQGREALTLMRDGVINELSIGFDALKWEMVKSGELNTEPIRHIKELRLWEISLVTFAADSEAKITSIHNKLLAPIEAFLEALNGIEQFEGKVLSAKNKKIVKDAIAALTALLEAAEPPDTDQVLVKNQSDEPSFRTLGARLQELREAELRLASTYNYRREVFELTGISMSED